MDQSSLVVLVCRSMVEFVMKILSDKLSEMVANGRRKMKVRQENRAA